MFKIVIESFIALGVFWPQGDESFDQAAGKEPGTSSSKLCSSRPHRDPYHRRRRIPTEIGRVLCQFLVEFCFDCSTKMVVKQAGNTMV